MIDRKELEELINKILKMVDLRVKRLESIAEKDTPTVKDVNFVASELSQLTKDTTFRKLKLLGELYGGTDGELLKKMAGIHRELLLQSSERIIEKMPSWSRSFLELTEKVKHSPQVKEFEMAYPLGAARASAFLAWDKYEKGSGIAGLIREFNETPREIAPSYMAGMLNALSRSIPAEEVPRQITAQVAVTLLTIAPDNDGVFFAKEAARYLGKEICKVCQPHQIKLLEEKFGVQFDDGGPQDGPGGLAMSL